MSAAADCPRARSSMTPCVIRNGDDARADDGACVGCGVVLDRVPTLPSDAPAEDRTRSPLSRKLDSSAKWYAEYDESGRRAERFREYAEDARQLEAENARLTAALDRVRDERDRLAHWLRAVLEDDVDAARTQPEGSND